MSLYLVSTSPFYVGRKPFEFTYGEAKTLIKEVFIVPLAFDALLKAIQKTEIGGVLLLTHEPAKAIDVIKHLDLSSKIAVFYDHKVTGEVKGAFHIESMKCEQVTDYYGMQEELIGRVSRSLDSPDSNGELGDHIRKLVKEHTSVAEETRTQLSVRERFDAKYPDAKIETGKIGDRPCFIIDLKGGALDTTANILNPDEDIDVALEAALAKLIG